MKNLNKSQIVSKIYKRFNKALSKRKINDSINVICDVLIQELLANNAVSVKNFGTLSPYLFHEHIGMNVSSGRLQKISSFRSVKFHPHHTFITLIANRRASLVKSKSRRQK